MRCFLLGFIGALLLLIVAAFGWAQYGDYRGLSDTHHWLVQLEKTRDQISENAKLLESVSGSGLGVELPSFHPNNVETGFIDESGIIVLKGGPEGHIVVLKPSLVEGKVVWRCLAGPEETNSLYCKHPNRD